MPGSGSRAEEYKPWLGLLLAVTVALVAWLAVKWLAAGGADAPPTIPGSKRSSSAPSGGEVPTQSAGSRLSADGQVAERSLIPPVATERIELGRRSVRVRVVDAQTRQPIPNVECAWISSDPETLARLRPRMMALSEEERFALTNSPVLSAARFGDKAVTDAEGFAQIEVRDSAVSIAVANEIHRGYQVFVPKQASQPWVVVVSPMRSLAIQVEATRADSRASLEGVPIVLDVLAAERGWAIRTPLGSTGSDGRLVCLDTPQLAARIKALGVRRVRLRIAAPGSPPGDWYEREQLLLEPPPTAIVVEAPPTTEAREFVVQDVEGRRLERLTGWLSIEDGLGDPWRYYVRGGRVEVPRVVRDAELEWEAKVDDTVLGRVSSPSGSRVACTSTKHRVCYLRLLDSGKRPLPARTKVDVRFAGERRALGCTLGPVIVDARNRVRLVLPAAQAGPVRLIVDQQEAVFELPIGKAEVQLLSDVALQASTDLLVLEPIDAAGVAVANATVRWSESTRRRCAWPRLQRV